MRKALEILKKTKKIQFLLDSSLFQLKRLTSLLQMTAQRAITSSKLTTEVLEQVVKYIQS